MENKNITVFIAAFIALIVGVSLLSVVATQGNLVVDKITVAGESIDFGAAIMSATTNGTINETYSFTIANPPTGWETTGCPISNFVATNASTTFVSGTDYVLTESTGVITFNNTVNMNATAGDDSNITNVTYTYCSSDYMTQGWQRTVLKLVPGFFALALIGVGIGLFYTIMKGEGVLD